VNRKIFLLTCLSLLLFISACEKRFNNPVAKKYVIAGRLFEDYELEAIQDFPLELIYYEINGRNEWVAEETVDRYVTEGDGYFEFKYSKFSSKKEGFLAIQQDASKREKNQAIVSEAMLHGISLNEDFNRSITISPMSRTYFALRFNSRLEGDTFLFVSSSQRAYHDVDILNYTRFSLAGKVLIGSNLNFKITHNWSGNLSEDYDPLLNKSTLRYGTSIEDYKKALYSSRIDSIPDDYNRKTFVQSGFPFIDTVHIELD